MKIKKKISVVFKFSLAFIVSIIVLELFLSLAHISLSSIVTIDAGLGRKLRPNTRVVKFGEGFYIGKINQYGYTGTAYPPERNRDALRIALVGDSFVEGHCIFERFHLGKILERKLSGLIQREVEVLNFGLSGICFRQMYINYSKWITGFKPDLTLFFMSAIDLLEKEHHDGPRCYLEDGVLRINSDFTRSILFKVKSRLEFIRSSSFYPLIQRVYFRSRKGDAAGILLGALNPFKPGKGKGEGRSSILSTTREDDDLFEINRTIFKVLKALNDTGRTRNIVVLESRIPVYYEDAINRAGLPLIKLGPKLERMKMRGVDPLYWKATDRQGHWNHETHRMIGNHLADSLAAGLKD